jgi:hypothetical protein
MVHSPRYRKGRERNNCSDVCALCVCVCVCEPKSRGVPRLLCLPIFISLMLVVFPLSFRKVKACESNRARSTLHAQFFVSWPRSFEFTALQGGRQRHKSEKRELLLSHLVKSKYETSPQKHEFLFFFFCPVSFFPLLHLLGGFASLSSVCRHTTGRENQTRISGGFTRFWHSRSTRRALKFFLRKSLTLLYLPLQRSSLRTQ